MPRVVQFPEPGRVELVREESLPLTEGTVRIRTQFSGISAGTELTAFRGTNPYLNRHWDPDQRLFTEGAPTFSYPLTGWGYSEVGAVVEVAEGVSAPQVGDTVYGIWGHRSETVLPAAAVASARLPGHVSPVHGVFARVGAIALNAVLAAEVALGERVAIFGQGVIGLLATRLATLSGARVVAIDAVPHRLQTAMRLGAAHTVRADHPGGAAEAVRDQTGGRGADSAIELSGAYSALHEAIRSVSPGATVVASGFYQGDAAGLRLGEEFHHNRARIVASQISGVPARLTGRWDHARLNAAVIEQIAHGALDVEPLLSHVLPVERVHEAFELLDTGSPEALQVVLAFEGAQQ